LIDFRVHFVDTQDREKIFFSKSSFLNLLSSQEPKKGDPNEEKVKVGAYCNDLQGNFFDLAGSDLSLMYAKQLLSKLGLEYWYSHL